MLKKGCPLYSPVQKSIYNGVPSTPLRFISFEGIDGSGKTTQTILLSYWLTERGYKVLITEEPTRELVTGYFVKIALRHKDRLPREVYPLLFLADRLNHVKNRILPALESGKIVISDRYHFSMLAYQPAQGIGIEKIETILKVLEVELPIPDLTILLDIPVEEALERLAEREKGIVDEFERREFLSKVRENYLKLADEYGFLVVDGTLEPLEIHKKIIRRLKKYFPPLR